MSTSLTDEIEGLLRGAGSLVEDVRGEAVLLVEAARRAGAEDGMAARARALAAERVAGRPLGYVAGFTRFMGVELESVPGAIVPRAETELLAKAAIDILSKISPTPRAIDMCCGSGNLACAIAVHVPSAQVWASDLTSGCVTLASRNVERLNLSGRVTCKQGDLFAPLRAADLAGTVDVVVCNPPYISTGRLGKDRAALLEHEPREAFDGGPYGLTVHQRVIDEAVEFLRPGGWLMFEVGLGQQRQVFLLFGRSMSYQESQARCDERDQPRVVMAQKKWTLPG